MLLLHYWLVNHRGGEKVLDVFQELFPEAEILTHVYNAPLFDQRFPRKKVRCTFINSLPLATKMYQKYLPLMPLALKMADVSKYDFLLSSESGPIKGVDKRPDAVHICYCHTPMRYVWDMFDQYQAQAGLVAGSGMKLTRTYMRNYDLRSAEKVNSFIANSAFVAKRIKKIYDRDSTVIFPPVETDFFAKLPRNEQDYYLYAGELCFYKRPDLVVAAFLRNGRKLVVAGSGAEFNRLRKMAWSAKNITFTGRVDDLHLRELYRGCRAMIFPGIEDFGIMPVEAQATGAPVIALGLGGALETVKSNQTGLHFFEQNVDAILNTVELFETLSFDSQTIRDHAASFSRNNFTKNISDYLFQFLPR